MVANWLVGVNIASEIKFSPDTEAYIEWSNALIALNFDLTTFLPQNNFYVPLYFYLIPIELISILRCTFGDAWTVGFKIINLISLVTLLVAYWRTATLLRLLPSAIAIGFILIAFSPDFLIWPNYLLTDTLYMTIVMLGVWASVVFGLGKSNRNGPLIAMALVCTALSATRPSSPPLILAFMLSLSSPLMTINFKNGLVLLGAVIGVTIAFSLAYGIGIDQLLEQSSRSHSAQLTYILDQVRDGSVIHHRFETYRPPPEGIMEISTLYLVRVMSFFSPYAQGFSLGHLVLVLIHTIAVSAAILMAFIRISRLSIHQRSTVLMLLMAILGTALYHSGILIDYDWRYRAPTALPMILLATIGISSFLGRVSKQKSVFKQPHRTACDSEQRNGEPL
jgi:hypothetical protein